MTHDLTIAFAGGLGPLVRDRAALLAVDVDLEPEIDQAVDWLTSELGRLLAAPFDRQTRGPLELAQEAVKFPTAKLASLGVEPVRRDPVAVSALPGDLYGLAPLSSRDLGDTAWEAHLAWGAAKAAAMRDRRSAGAGDDG